ncbi:MAG: gliding motility-associated C-terminal domain-containing protein [Flavobacteriaceae bacterium]|nr:gliding motility-associated C-terminal domain-containing protein [Flavobacteriaceae bacterium]
MSQTIVFGTPTLNFSQACASSGFNTYNISFTFYPASNVQAGNQFIIELSNASGNFDAPVTVGTSTTTTSPANVSFSLPTNTAGENYRIRVRSTAPAVTSPVSSPFAAYYATHNQPFSINNNAGSLMVCEGSSFSLQIDNNGTPSSPLYYPELTYKWFRNFSEIPGQTGPNLPITQSGNYYVIVDYGSCVMNSYSNIVTVDMVSGIDLTINTSDGSDFICSGYSKTLVSSHQNSNYNYQWYRNNQPISGATQSTYSATLEGTYKLIISVGGCTFESNNFFLELIDIEADLDVNATEILIPGTTLTVNSITNAVNPSYQWKRNNVNIAGATSDSYTITQNGNYTLVVTENQNCNLTAEVSVNVVYPDNFHLAIGSTGDYQSCMSTIAPLNITVFNAISGANTISILNNNYGYTYQWYRNNQPISGATQTTYDATQNGNYHLQVVLPGISNPVISNTITIALGSSTPLNITQSGSYCNSTTNITFNSNLTDSSYTYQWYRNNAVISGAINNSYTTNQTGNYHLVITYGSCTLTSNNINIEGPSATLDITNPDVDIILPGEQKVLNTTTSLTQPTYQWYRNNVAISGATSASYTATQDGVYKVEAIQTAGCNITLEDFVTLSYPDSFTLTIQAASDYQSCNSSSANLIINSFTAHTSQGIFNVGISSLYALQWKRNGANINGAQSETYTVNHASQNGSYQLEITLPGFGTIASNNLTVSIAIETPDISASGNLCEGEIMMLNSSVTDSEYTYIWYKDGIVITGVNQPSLEVTQNGNYHLSISHASCSVTSNAINIEETNITASLNVASVDIIIPGESKILTVTTDAIQPFFQWYRDNIVISGANGVSYTATQSGTYKVVVTQTGDCAATQEVVVNLIYPTGFNVVIAPDSNYQNCNSQSTTLRIVSFMAQSQAEQVSILNNNYGYTYQWYKDNVLIISSTSTDYFISSREENGEYELRVVIPEFNIIVSNIVSIHLGVSDDFVITTDSEVICENNDTAILSTEFSNINYILKWYRIGENTVIGTQNNITVSTAGQYYVEIDFDGCTYTSNTITINNLNESVISLSEPEHINLFEGSSKTIFASGGESYYWYFENQHINNGNNITITEEGIYTLIAFVGNCEIIKTITVTKIENNSLVVPNVVTLNNDGRNDFWSVPETFTNKENVEIIIYNSNGKVIFRSRNYQNNWPNDTYKPSKTDPVVYYTISENDEIIKRGSITIIE